MASTEHHASDEEYETPSGSEYSFYEENESPKYYSDSDEYWNSDKDGEKSGSDDEKSDSDDEKVGSSDEKSGVSGEKVESADGKVGSADGKVGSSDEKVEDEKHGSKAVDDKGEDDDKDKGLPKEILDFISKHRKTPAAPAPDDTKSDDGHDDHRDHHDGDHRGDIHHHSKHARRILLSRVLMPSGKLCAITVPAQVSQGWKCGDKTKFISLRPNGQMGKREYTIVKKEMEKSRSMHRTGKYSGFNIIKIQKVVNPCLWNKYKDRRNDIIGEAGEANERLLFHGSKAVWRIVQSGFDERHSNLNGSFGAGLYFASNATKSNMFVFGSKGCPTHNDFNCFICERKMLLCRVALGKVSLLVGAQKIAHPPPGYQSIEGRPIPEMPRYNEYVVYRGEQAYPEYVITYKLVK